MACRVTGRKKVSLLNTLSPTYREVVETYTRSQGIEVSLMEEGLVSEETACLIAQHPNFYGYLEDLAGLEKVAHGAGALLVVATDPLTSGLFRPPGGIRGGHCHRRRTAPGHSP